MWVSRTLTDWVCLLHVEQADPVFDILWSEDVFAEAQYHLRKKNPEHSHQAIHRRFARLRNFAASGEVKDYAIIDQSHPDAGDWHVINAALHGGAGYLITEDKKFRKFPSHDNFPFEIHTPDTFLMLVLDSAPTLVEAVVVEQQRYWCSKGEPFNLASQLQKAGALQFSEHVRNMVIRRFH